ncbi:MAG: hypothetical protein EPO22_09085 [Dehalococcoidia bacterium]|nr:MAG: hypothetical protein EPO22_09085 [Dehalococcoidia bacterium]
MLRFIPARPITVRCKICRQLVACAAGSAIDLVNVCDPCYTQLLLDNPEKTWVELREAYR